MTVSVNPLDGPPVRYTTGWNPKLRKPLLGRVWLTEDEARIRFDSSEGGFQVVDARAEAGDVPSFLIGWAPYSDQGWLGVTTYGASGSNVVHVDIRPRDGRYFVDRVTRRTYPDEERYHSLLDALTITTTTFEPDGSGTLTVVDKLERENNLRMEARDIPVAEHWIDRFPFGRWGVLLNLPMLTPSNSPR